MKIISSKKKKINEIYTNSNMNRQPFQGFLIRTALISNMELIEFEIIHIYFKIRSHLKPFTRKSIKF